ATFRAGINRGMDHLVTWEGYGRILNAISAVMTEQRFGQGGYALSDCIRSDLENRGLTADPEIAKRAGVTVPQNLDSGPFLDKLLQDTWSDLQNLPSSCGSAVRGLGGDDVGYVDFAKIAFSLFGLQIRAFYYLFFLIYGLTLLTGLLERQRDRLGQVVLLATAGLIFVSCYYSTFLLLPEPAGSGNMLNPRFMPVLALVPGIHLLLMLVDKAPPVWWRVALVIFQSGVIFFAIHIRVSAIFWVPALLLAALVLFLLALKGSNAGIAGWRSAAFRRLLAAQWPALVAVLVILGGLKVVVWSLNPVYQRDGWVPYHTVWHAIYFSLQLNPRFEAKYGAYHDGKTNDDMPYAGAFAYLKEHPEQDKPELFFPGSRSLRYTAMERLVRSAFFEFAWRDPWFVFETFFIVKGKMIWDQIAGATATEWARGGWTLRCLFFLTAALIGGMAAQGRAEFQRLSALTAVIVIGSLASLSIPLLTVAFAQTMTEEIMMIQIGVALLLSLSVAYLVRAVQSQLTWFEPAIMARPSPAPASLSKMG
ncbi:MAG: hypothetical protein ACREO5_03185, partial [Candidatus Binatia bacterium]